ncbi:Type VII secretion system ESAT-6-like [Desulfitobacterium hafniense]|uniref:Type VII secretion system ESAT-6-like n=1 Tax=Desulfitobacterium hafniense TaxID=49338 RepID=A0A098B7W1_DESHA|nr:WXG100 family type VII secretion target [Desulfitobacterium hafniense]CDX04958.1 Type VII secretion system ESAT-6-like [Desulfitobacterium hafniense]
MSTQITIDSEQVLAIASQIESDNQQLQQLLNDSKATVDSLSSYWMGRASDETRASYESFANKFFQSYYDVLNQYVKFLRNNVAMQYEQTEQVNTQLADAFK